MNRGTRNVVRVSLSMMVLFSAILSQEFIQEVVVVDLSETGVWGIKREDGYGTLSVIYFCNTVTCPFAPALVNRITGKWAMVAAMGLAMMFQASLLYPVRWILYTAAVATGIGTTLLWVGQGQYVTQNVSKENMETMTAIQWALYKTSLIIGGIFFLLFFQDRELHDIVRDGMMRIFALVFLSCTVVALINTAFLPQSESVANGSSNQQEKTFKEATKEVFKLLNTKRMKLLAVFFAYTGFVRSFWISIFPACIKFTAILSSNTTSAVSWAMFTTGVGQVSGSILVSLLGKRIRKFGQHFLVFATIFLHICVFAIIGMSFPKEAPHEKTFEDGPILPANMTTAMIMCALLGFGDAVLQTQVYAYIAHHYKKESSAAFAIFRFSSGIASTVLFLVAQHINLIVQTSLLITAALVGAIAILMFHKCKVAPGVAPGVAPVQKSQILKKTSSPFLVITSRTPATC